MMTAPVEVYVGETLMLTRKISEDRFMLKPTPEVKALVVYMILYWAERTDVEVLAIIILSNHLHVIYRHVTGNGPLFCQMAEHWIARIMNMRLDRVGHAFFAPGPCRPMRLLRVDEVERALNYAVANAVLHGLTERSYDWPGLVFGPEDVGETLKFRRPPELRFSETFPETIEFVVPAAVHLRGRSNAEIKAKFARLRVATETNEHSNREGKFLGVSRAMAVARFSRPESPKRSEFQPFFTSSDPLVLAAAKLSRALFLEAHKKRLNSFRDGDRCSDWPPGTYKMRRTYGLPP